MIHENIGIDGTVLKWFALHSLSSMLAKGQKML